MDLPNKCKGCEHLFYVFRSQDKIPCCTISGFEVYGLLCLRDNDFRSFVESRYRELLEDFKESNKGE